MQTTARWIYASLLACLAATLAALVFDAWSRFEMVEWISSVSFSEIPAGSVPVSPGTREESLMLPHSSVDARWWVIHTRQMLRRGDWRVRSTTLDNAPDGREVHWSSLPMWTLAALAWMRSIGTGEPAWHFVANAALAIGPLAMVFLFAGLFWIARRAFGLAPALLYLLVLLTSNSVLRTFQLGEADHHGIVLAFGSACVLCLLAGGLGYTKKNGPTPARWFAASGIAGAAAMWISASTSLPIIAATGLGALICGLSASKKSSRPPLQPRLWLTWSAWGCATSLAFYILEYFPGRMGWRMEVNHPLYSLAWLGGGWLLSRFLQARLDKRFPFQNASQWMKAFICLSLVLAPLLAIMLAGEAVFWVSDPFLLALHKEYILEFQSLAGLLASKNQSPLLAIWLHLWAGIALAGAAIPWRRSYAILRGQLLLLLPPTVVMQALALWQVRWGSAAAALWALWILVLAAAVLRLPEDTILRRFLVVVAACAPWAALATGPLPMAAAAAKEEQNCLNAPLEESVGGNLLIRDIALRLIQSSPGKVPTVLTGPNTSTELVFHSGLRTLGTLYWENMPGLKRAAEIFSATNESDTRRLLEEAGVTHLVVPSWSDFGAAYAGLLAKARGKEQADPSYLDGVLKYEEFPIWLRPFAYPIPTASGIDSQSVRIIAFIPGQNAFESWFHRGIYHYESGQPAKARAAFEHALALRPGEPRVVSYLRQLPAPAQ